MSLARRVSAFLLASWLATVALASAAQAPQAVQGRLDLPSVPRDALPLQGEWAFAWQQFLDPGWTALPAGAFAHVPSSWNELRAGGKPPGENGWGSYALLLNCPAGSAMAIEAVGQRTASRLFVNGTLVAVHGEPGTSAQATQAAVHSRIPITRSFACPLRITLHVANFDHRAGGFVRPLNAGSVDALERAREAGVVHGAAFLTIYLLTGLVSLIFFAVRRRERVPLLFGLFCIAIAVYTDMIGQRLLLRPLDAQVSWVAYMRVEYLSWVAAMALFFLTLRGLFPAEIHRRAVQLVLGLLGLAAVAVLLLRPGIYSYVVFPGQAIAVLVGAYVVTAMVRAAPERKVDARVLLAGLLAVVATLVIDLLLIDAPRPDQKFAPAGFALFLLSPAVVIARRMSQALNAEERSRTLEENARLREDVERISRHDLKTPLNSVLGAARLLRDDPQLTGDQRELVDVLQRAGLRMLEMVNLSLGLFRMETGTYELRPQTVDLREVVSRVLVDLHSYAQASDVTLHWNGSRPVPLYVRGEELLCYSIIANLVKNAIEGAGAGARVTATLMPGDPVALSVHNPGVVPPEIAARFFEKYVTGRKSGGTGLGTYSALLMAQTQGGNLALHSTASEGTTVTLTLPPLRGEAPVVPAAPLPPTIAEDWLQALQARTVLVVDDDELTRFVTRRLLPSPPFQVETAINGQAAIESMATRWPDYLLVDMEMPVMNGLETVRWVRRQEAAQGRPRCRVVMVSGNDDEGSASAARDAGVDRFLAKPVSRERLLAALRELVDAPPPGAAPSPAGSGEATVLSLDDHGTVTIAAEWKEVLPEVLRLQGHTIDAMGQALAAGDRQQLQMLGHRAYGALATVGLHWAARQSRILEDTALYAPMEQLESRVGALRGHLEKVRLQLA